MRLTGRLEETRISHPLAIVQAPRTITGVGQVRVGYSTLE